MADEEGNGGGAFPKKKKKKNPFRAAFRDATDANPAMGDDQRPVRPKQSKFRKPLKRDKEKPPIEVDDEQPPIPAARATTTSFDKKEFDTSTEVGAILAQHAARLAELQQQKENQKKLIQAKTLSQATANIGQCMDMCPEIERLFREQGKELDFLEMIPGTEHSPHPLTNAEYAVKKFKRPSANLDNTENIRVEDVRPPPVLQRTTEYLFQKVLMRSDVELHRRYHFIADRTRQIRMDFYFQNIFDSQSIEIHEQIARFHIVMGYRLCTAHNTLVDMDQNLEQTKKTLTTLRYAYDGANRDGVYCPNEAVFRAYFVLIQMYYIPHTDYEISAMEFQFIQQLPPELISSPPIQFALQVWKAMLGNNYIRFFKLLQQADYLTACILHLHLNNVRGKALKVIEWTWNQTSGTNALSIEDMKSLLLFETDEEAIRFAEHHGFTVQGSSIFMNPRNPSFEKPENPFKRNTYSFIDQKDFRPLDIIITNAEPLSPEQLVQQERERLFRVQQQQQEQQRLQLLRQQQEEERQREEFARRLREEEQERLQREQEAKLRLEHEEAEKQKRLQEEAKRRAEEERERQRIQAQKAEEERKRQLQLQAQREEEERERKRLQAQKEEEARKLREELERQEALKKREEAQIAQMKRSYNRIVLRGSLINWQLYHQLLQRKKEIISQAHGFLLKTNYFRRLREYVKEMKYEHFKQSLGQELLMPGIKRLAIDTLPAPLTEKPIKRPKLQQNEWVPFNLPHLIFDLLARKNPQASCLYWKLIISSPEPVIQKSLFMQWISTKFTTHQMIELEDDVETLTLSLYDAEQIPLKICVKALSFDLQQHCFAAQAVMFLLPPVEDNPDFWMQHQNRLRQIMNQFPNQKPPVLIVTPERRWLSPDAATYLYSQLNLLSTDCNLCVPYVDSVSSERLAEGVQWLASRCPPLPLLSSGYMSDIVERCVAAQVRPLYQERRSGIPAPEEFIQVFNDSLARVSGVVADPNLSQIMWPIPEFEEDMPAMWNSPKTLESIKQALASIQLPPFQRSDGEPILESFGQWLTILAKNNRETIYMLASETQRIISAYTMQLEHGPLVGNESLIPWHLVFERIFAFQLQDLELRFPQKVYFKPDCSLLHQNQRLISIGTPPVVKLSKQVWDGFDQELDESNQWESVLQSALEEEEQETKPSLSIAPPWQVPLISASPPSPQPITPSSSFMAKLQRTKDEDKQIEAYLRSSMDPSTRQQRQRILEQFKKK